MSYSPKGKAGIIDDSEDQDPQTITSENASEILMVDTPQASSDIVITLPPFIPLTIFLQSSVVDTTVVFAANTAEEDANDPCLG